MPQKMLSIKLKKKISNAKFIIGDISDNSLEEKLKVNISSSDTTLIYSRFSLHAISENQELDFWKLVNNISIKGDYMALEFRTEKDEKLTTNLPRALQKIC